MGRSLVTGATGFVGSNLCHALKIQGRDVIGTGIAGEQDPGIPIIGYNLDCIPDDLLEGISVVFHQAANNATQEKDEGVMRKANVQDPIALFKQLHRLGCRKFVYASSAAVYGDVTPPFKETGETRPLTPYAASKLEFEGVIKTLLPESSIIGMRYCNVYGPGESHKGSRASMIYQLFRSIVDGKCPKLFEFGEQKRDWIFVDDVVSANLSCESQDGIAIHNVSSGETTTFNEIVDHINKNIGTKFVPEYIKNPISETYQDETGSDISSLKSCGWTPSFGIGDGIRNSVDGWLLR